MLVSLQTPLLLPAFYPYPHLYPYQYHLRHLENAGWERGLVDSLAEKREDFSGKKVPLKLWPIIAGHNPLTGNEGDKRLDNNHRPGWVVHDLAGVQASTEIQGWQGNRINLFRG